MRLTNDSEQIIDGYGFDPVRSLLFTNIRRDSSRIVKPIIAERGEQRTLLVRQQESGAILAAGVPRERVRFHTGWVTFDRRLVEGTDVAERLSALVAELAGDEPVELAPGIAYAHLQEFERHSGLAVSVVADPADSAPVTVIELDADDVLARFAEWRAAAVAYGRGFVGRFPGLDGIEAYFDATTDTRFSALERLAGELGVDAFSLSAPPNFSEVTARRDAEGLSALWLPGDRRVFVIASDDEPGVAGRPVGRYASRAEAIRALVPGPALAVEEEWITASFAASLEDAGLEPRNASIPLGSWRDLRDVEDLPFQVIAARASTFAIESALGRLQRRLESGSPSSEDELYRDYLAAIQEFRARHEVPFAIEPYFTNLHASDRTLFPTPPIDAPITLESGCVELDAGVRVAIDGVVVATSDMGRTLPLTPGARRGYDTLTRVIRDRIIPSIRPGVPMSAVHERALDALTEVRGELEAAGLLEEDTDFVSWYRKRNVGHLMGKQESFANELRPGFPHVLRVGDYGAAETPWRFGALGISTEDLWFVGEDRTYTLTLS